MKAKNYGEKRLIRDVIFPIIKNDIDVGLGDDSSIIRISDFDIIASTDKIPEDLMALRLGLMTPFEHGRYLSEVNISDIAAMGGVPKALLLNLTMPDDFSIEYLESFLKGVKSSCKKWDVIIAGGDTKWGSTVCFSATCIGVLDKGKAIRRNGAKIGDYLFVSGIFGLFSTALLYFLAAKPSGFKLKYKEEIFLKNKLVLPEAKVDVGIDLNKSMCCSSCMDITDGFSQSLYELSDSSNVSFEIKECLFNYHELTYKLADYFKCTPNDIAFGVGLDLELLFTIKPEGINKISKHHILLGQAIEKESNMLLMRDGSSVVIEPKGWEHFTGKTPVELVKLNSLQRNQTYEKL